MMKHFFMALFIAMSCWSFQSSAAEVDLGLVEVSTNFNNSFNTATSFEDEYEFTLPANNTRSSYSLTNSIIDSSGLISNFKATLNGILLSFTSIPGANALSLGVGTPLGAGPHKLVIEGDASAGSRYDGNIFVVVDQGTPEVPVPAAVWLFGSGIVGLFGVKRRKASV